MSWPNPQDYQEAVQNPSQNFVDEELKKGQLVLNRLGLPSVTSGSFASVYKMICHGKPVAVRVFLRDIAEIETRYEAISRFVMSDDLVYTVSFEYVKQGIRVHGKWFPVLKMQWVDGECLDAFVKRSINSPKKIANLRRTFRKMMSDLQQAGIAHGDLQHGNILVLDNGNDLRLVDYDGMFVPGLRGHKSAELGHRNYQHPTRGSIHFDERLDNFSVWTIDTALQIVEHRGSALAHNICLDECLIFKQTDFNDPEGSPTFHLLENDGLTAVREAARSLRRIVHTSVEGIPFLDEPSSIDLSSLPALRQTSLIQASPLSDSSIKHTVAGGVPWWRDRSGTPFKSNAVSQLQAGTPKAEPAWATGNWPSVQEYIEALADPKKAFTHKDLRRLRFSNEPPIKSSHGLIFRVQLDGHDHALKVFHVGHLADLEIRYEQYEQAYRRLIFDRRADYLVRCKLYKEAVQINNKRFPCVLMDWVDGEPLDTLMQKLCRASKVERELLQYKLRKMAMWLREMNIVHGDPHPSNILFDDANIKLVDYDTIRVSNFIIPSPQPISEELIHPLDPSGNGSENYAFWVIDTNVLLASQRILLPITPANSNFIPARAFAQKPGPRWTIPQEIASRLDDMARIATIHPRNVPAISMNGTLPPNWTIGTTGTGVATQSGTSLSAGMQKSSQRGIETIQNYFGSHSVVELAETFVMTASLFCILAAFVAPILLVVPAYYAMGWRKLSAVTKRPVTRKDIASLVSLRFWSRILLPCGASNTSFGLVLVGIMVLIASGAHAGLVQTALAAILYLQCVRWSSMLHK